MKVQEICGAESPVGHKPQVVNRQEAEALCTWLVTSNGCMAARVLSDGTVAALQDLLFTRAIVLGCAGDGWAQRFCFEDRSLALRRFAELESEDDVPAGHAAIKLVDAPGPVDRYHVLDGAG